MPTFQQLLRSVRGLRRKKKIDRILWSCPQKKATILKLWTVKPKKPNSAIRKIAKVWILSTWITVLVYIPGQGHSLQEHSQILVWGGWVPDLPGVHYKAIKGKLDFSPKERFQRIHWWSKFGVPTPSETSSNIMK